MLARKMEGLLSMAGYRTFNPRFWEDDFILDLSKDEKYFYFYLITNPKTTLWGIYEISFKVINFHTGLTEESIKKLLIKLQSKEKIIFDEKTNEVCIRNYLKHNFNPSPLVIKSIVGGFKGIKNQNLIQYLNGINTLSIPYKYPIDTVMIPTVTVTVIDTVINKSLKAFKKPSLEEISSYCIQNGYTMDPEKFFNYQESKGWKVGTAPMKDWQSAVDNWEIREKEFVKERVSKPNGKVSNKPDVKIDWLDQYNQTQ